MVSLLKYIGSLNELDILKWYIKERTLKSMVMVFVLVKSSECHNESALLSNIFDTGKSPLQSPASLEYVASSLSPYQSFSSPEQQVLAGQYRSSINASVFFDPSNEHVLDLVSTPSQHVVEHEPVQSPHSLKGHMNHMTLI